MFPGVSFNEVNLDVWKPASQGYFSITLRWIPLHEKRKHLLPEVTLRTKALSVFVSCWIQIWDAGLCSHITMVIVPLTWWKQYTHKNLPHTNWITSKLNYVIQLTLSWFKDEPVWKNQIKSNPWIRMRALFLIVLRQWICHPPMLKQHAFG